MTKKNLSTVVLVTLAIVVLAACEKKKESTTIITKIEQQRVSDEILTVGGGEKTQTFEWNGSLYELEIEPIADKDAPTVKDDDGNRYYQNRIEVELEGPAGTVFERTFSRADFESYIDQNYLKPSRSTLVSISFSRVDAANAYFIATIGSPNQMDDEYMLVQMAVSKSGGMTLSRLQEDD